MANIYLDVLVTTVKKCVVTCDPIKSMELVIVYDQKKRDCH